MGLTHLAVKFSFGYGRRNRIDDKDVNCARLHQCVSDLKCLLACVWLRDQQVVHIHAEFLCVGDIKRVLGIHKGRYPATALRLSDDL